MPTYTPTQLYKGSLTNVLTTNLYTAGSKTIVKEISICNYHTGVVNVTISAGAAGSEKKLLNEEPFDANESRRINCSTVLNATEVIDGGDDVGSVVDVFISGTVIT